MYIYVSCYTPCANKISQSVRFAAMQHLPNLVVKLKNCKIISAFFRRAHNHKTNFNHEGTVCTLHLPESNETMLVKSICLGMKCIVTVNN